MPSGNRTSTSTTDGTLLVLVPEDALVTINGHATQSTGSQRQYFSRDLNPGATYSYEIRATRMVDGHLAEDHRIVQLKAGESEAIVLDFAPTSNEHVASTK
jgi:uncharacterized protein (TIGR03000 family)